MATNGNKYRIQRQIREEQDQDLAITTLLLPSAVLTIIKYKSANPLIFRLSLKSYRVAIVEVTLKYYPKYVKVRELLLLDYWAWH